MRHRLSAHDDPIPRVSSRPVVVFADIDSVLGMSDAAAFAAAAQVRGSLEDVAIVFCSRRTRAEIELVYQQLHCRHPFICEQGRAVVVPEGYFPPRLRNSRAVAGHSVIDNGLPFASVSDTLRRTAQRLRIDIQTWSEMSIEDVARDCDLTLLQARLAKLREYTERFRLLNPAPGSLERLTSALQIARLRCLCGYPFHEVGSMLTPGVGIELLVDLYRRARGTVITIGFADASAANDVLTRVAHPMLIEPRSSASVARAASQHPRVPVREVGGWMASLAQIVDMIRTDDRQGNGPADASRVSGPLGVSDER